MNKAELKNFLLIYDKIKDSIEGGKEYAYIWRCNRKQKIMFPEWLYKLPDYIEGIIKSEDNPLFTYIIQESVIFGKTDKKTLAEVPLSESSYYRYKRKFENKLYELFIVAGYVTREEILRAKITD